MAPSRETLASSAVPRKSILKRSTQPRKLETESLFTTSKKDKRRIKHSQLISKVEKSANKAKSRRRRPSKKLITTLDSLADALPNGDDDQGGNSEAAGSRLEHQVNIIKRKSVKSRPGAMKRREKLDRTERDRFVKNLAQMTGGAPTQDITTAPNLSDRWKALRGFISQTMEKKPELAGASG